jgi:hypothetical protein
VKTAALRSDAKVVPEAFRDHFDVLNKIANLIDYVRHRGVV